MIRRSNDSLFDRQKALGMVYDEQKHVMDAKQLDVQKMTIYCPQNHLKETASLKDIQRSG